jgi:alpha-tubulin suppressor-like RCC1 family protein
MGCGGTPSTPACSSSGVGGGSSVSCGTGGAATTGGGSAMVASVSVGDGQSCVLYSNGTVKCWGLNIVGQVGDGTTTDRHSAVPVSGVTSAIKVIAGDRNTCVMTSDGNLVCWGDNADHQLGSATTAAYSATPAVIPDVSGIKDFAVGYQHICAITSSGTVKCWGNNSDGQLGNGTILSSTTPVTATDVTNAKALSANHRHTCAMTTGGSVFCWGLSWISQTTPTRRLSPTQVENISNAVSIASGADSDYALLSDYTVAAWGMNNYGQLGDGNTSKTEYTDLARIVIPSFSASRIFAGGFEACAIVTDGSLNCWGSNDYGELGIGSATPATAHATPVAVPGMSSTAFAAVGGNSVCAIPTNGGVKCWGWNIFGQLGDGTTTDSASPTSVIGL